MENYGNADALNLAVMVYVDGTYAGSVTYPSIPATAHGRLGIIFAGGFSVGSHTIRFTANISDSNVADNSAENTFTWKSGVDLELTTVYRPSSLAAGQDTTVNCQISNIGYNSAGGFWVMLHVDGAEYDAVYVPGIGARSVIAAPSITIAGGLTPGTHYIGFEADYTLEVKESNESNNYREASYTWQGNVNPPSNLTAGPGASSGSIRLKWDPPSYTWGLIGYIVYEEVSPGNFREIAAAAGTETTLPGYTPGVTYCFTLSALYEIEGQYLTSSRSNKACTMPAQDQAPTVPTLYLEIPANSSGTALRLSWTPSTDDSGVSPTYLLYRLTNDPNVSAYNYDYGFPKSISGTDYRDTGLSDHNTYYYVVRAVDSCGTKSGLSNIVSGSPRDTPAPKPPAGISAMSGSIAIDLQWDCPFQNTDGSFLYDLAGFNIYRRTATSGYARINPVLVFSGHYQDTAVVSGETYYYVVTAEDENGNESSFSNQVSAALKDDPPPAPDYLNITPKQTELSLCWAPVHVSDLAGYNLYRGTASGSYSPVPLNGAILTGLTYTDTDVASGQAYYYIVRAVDQYGQESENSNEVSGMIGQGVLYVVSPTSKDPALLWAGENLIIKYYLSPEYMSLYSGLGVVVCLEILDDDGYVVYRSYDDTPRPSSWDYDPVFTWNGMDMNGDPVPAGYYSTFVYILYDFLLPGPLAGMSAVNGGTAAGSTSTGTAAGDTGVQTAGFGGLTAATDVVVGTSQLSGTQGPGVKEGDSVGMCRLDLNADSNNDGIITQSDLAFHESGSGVIILYGDGEIGEEEAPEIFAVNAARGATGQPASIGALSVVEIGKSGGPEGYKLCLEASNGAANVKVWSYPTRTGQIILPKTYTIGKDAIPQLVYLEGCGSGEISLDLVLKTGQNAEVRRKRVKGTVLQVELEKPLQNQDFPMDMAGPTMPKVELKVKATPAMSGLQYWFRVGNRQTGRALEYEDVSKIMADEKLYNHPARINSGWVSSPSWNINFGGDIYGGHVTDVTVWIKQNGRILNCVTFKRDFYVVGGMLTGEIRNGYIDSLKSYCENIRTMAKAIAVHESFGTHYFDGSHFFASHFRYPLIEPGDGGVGVMQLTSQKLKNRDTVWNWKRNIAEGMAFIESECHDKAIEYLGTHPEGAVNDVMRRLEGYCRYNGGGNRYHWWNDGVCNVPEGCGELPATIGWQKFGCIPDPGAGGTNAFEDFNNDGVKDCDGNPFCIPDGEDSWNNDQSYASAQYYADQVRSKEPH
ncbi:MAG: CARDB domain-containing protein [Pseudomonadota bacterium]